MFDIEGFVYRQFDNPRLYGSPATDWKVNCPFCADRVGEYDRKGKLHISMHKQVVHCFRCDYTAHWWKFVGDILHTTNYIDIFRELYVVPDISSFQHLQEQFNTVPYITQPVFDFKLPEDFQELCSDVTTILLRKARKYAKHRGFGKSYWLKYNFGVAESVGWRLILPIEYDYWQARSLLNANPKYKNPVTNNARHCLFNSKALDLYEEIVVCEGVFSALSIGDNAIALLRKKATTEQIERLLKSKVKRFVLTIEQAAFPAMDGLADVLRRNGKQVILWCYNVGDPNDTVKPDKIVNYNLRNRVEMLLKL